MSMPSQLLWPVERLGDAIGEMAQHLVGGGVQVPNPSVGFCEGRTALVRWMEAAAPQVGLEATPVQSTYGQLRASLAGWAPAMIRVRDEAGHGGLLLVVGSHSSKRLRLLTPALETVLVSIDDVHALVARALHRSIDGLCSGLTSAAKMRGRRAQQAKRAVQEQWLGSAEIHEIWLLRDSRAEAQGHGLGHRGLLKSFMKILTGRVVETGLYVSAWYLLGQGALAGRLSWGWLAAWGLMLLSMAPIRLVLSWWQAGIVYRFGAWHKRRVIKSIVNDDVDRLQQQSAGMSLARVLDAESVEQLALGAGFQTLVGLVELSAAAAILFFSPLGVWSTVIVAAWATVLMALLGRYAVARRRWTEQRLDMSCHLIEHLEGHRTRKAQQDARAWHTADDASQSEYAVRASAMDRAWGHLMVAGAHGWLTMALVSLMPGLLWNGSIGVAGLAVMLGGVLLGRSAFANSIAGAAQAVDVWLCWQNVAHLVNNEEAAPHVGVNPASALAKEPSPATSPLRVCGLSIKRPGRAGTLLGCVDLEVQPGECLWLGGESGVGKSSLLSVLAGVRRPDSGIMMNHGNDLQTLGDVAWGYRVGYVPPLQQNHVFAGSFAFNVLLGGHWPPSAEALARAEAVARELGLGPLLDRMPAGMMQMVGDGGWPLSHGERARLFVARALVQRPDVVLLDECLGVLDPVCRRRVLDVVGRSVQSAVVGVAE